MEAMNLNQIPAPVKEMVLAGVTDTMERPVEEASVGRILRDHLAWILASEKFSKGQQKTAVMMAGCRTPALGTYIDYCPKCKKVVNVRYRSCNNRNCPGCQFPMQEKWIRLRKNEVIDGVPYFHIVLTVPHDLNPLIAENPRLLLGLLFRSSAQAVIDMCMDPKRLNAKPGIISVLHTWTQDLLPHYHIHMICSAAGVTTDGDFVALNSMQADENSPSGAEEENADLYQGEQAEYMTEDDNRWVNEESSASGFFLPLKALTALFRGKYMAELR